jgi:hypothetical protein
MITAAHLRGILFLGSGFHAIWSIAIRFVPGSLAHWLSEGATREIPSEGLYLCLSILITLVGISGAMYPQKLRKFLWLLPMIKLAEMIYAYLIIANQVFNPKLGFHLIANGLLWLVLYVYVVKHIPQSKN